MNFLSGFLTGAACAAVLVTVIHRAMTSGPSDAGAVSMSFDGITLIVKDLEAQRRFYRDMLGLELESDYGDAVFFRLGDRKLGLFARGHHSEGDESLEGAKKGVSHLEFGIRSAQFEGLRERLTKNGFHAYRDNFRDADGNLFHFNYDGVTNW